MYALNAYLESGSGSLLPSLVAFGSVAITVAVAFAAKRLAEQRGHNGWLSFFLVMFLFPIGVIAVGEPIGLASVAFLVAFAAAAKRLTDQRGRNGWFYFFLVLLLFPAGVVATGFVLFGKPVRTGSVT